MSSTTATSPRPIFGNYGAGTNSTAFVIEATRRGITFDCLLMSDTGSEAPHTYEYLQHFRDWLKRETDTELVMVRWIRKKGEHAGQFLAIHEVCDLQATLPSKAFGFPGCTVKWKQQPADAYVSEHPLTQAALADGGHVERWLGYDADEPHRFTKVQAKERAQLERMNNGGPIVPWRWRAPLIEWDMGREECIKVIKDAGLWLTASDGTQMPGKSACWLCPSSTKPEIARLRRNHPELYQHALRIEANCEAAGNKAVESGGLGQSLSWRAYDIDLQLQEGGLSPAAEADLVRERARLTGGDTAQSSIFDVLARRLPEPPAMECACWDGGE